jgi:hypothetical protein
MIRVAAIAAFFSGGVVALGGDDKPAPEYRRKLGEGSWKIRKEGGKTFVWAGGKRKGPESKWYDFTGSPIKPEELQFGIGKDRIPSIDDPLFVSTTDPRLSEISASPYRPEEKVETIDDIMVIGYVVGKEAKAYPTALLDHHELVNDRIGGKPLTVGW